MYHTLVDISHVFVHKIWMKHNLGLVELHYGNEKEKKKLSSDTQISIFMGESENRDDVVDGTVFVTFLEYFSRCTRQVYF